MRKPKFPHHISIYWLYECKENSSSGTGSGVHGQRKGKTTAAFGLAIRACMAGKKVFIGQFMKSIQYNETRIAKFIDNLSIEQFGNGCLLTRAPSAVDKQHAQDGLARCAELLSSGEWDVVIFDEITIALHMELISIDELMQALENRDPKTELCLLVVMLRNT